MARHDLRVWERPIANQTYVVGCDPAHGLERGDDSVIQVIRMETGVQVCEVQGKIDPIALGEKCYEVGTCTTPHWLPLRITRTVVLTGLFLIVGIVIAIFNRAITASPTTKRRRNSDTIAMSELGHT